MGVKRVPVGSTWDYEYDRREYRHYYHTAPMGVIRALGAGTSQLVTPPNLTLDTGAAAANKLIEVGENANLNGTGQYFPPNMFQDNYSIFKFSVATPTIFANPTATMWWGVQIGSFGTVAPFPWAPGASGFVLQVRARGDNNNVELICSPGDGNISVFTIGEGIAAGPWSGRVELLPGPNLPDTEGRLRVYIDNVLKREIRSNDIFNDWFDFGGTQDCGLGMFASSGSNAGGRIAVAFGPLLYEGIPLS